MGWLQKLKEKLGLPLEEAEDFARAPQKRGERPPLDGFAPAPQQSLDDALSARERGDPGEMRRLLAEMDRGQGLRLWLRGAAALEAKDEAELCGLMPALRREAAGWRLPLQIAMALQAGAIGSSAQAANKRGPKRAELTQLAAERGAPDWAVAWSRALSPERDECRRGLCDLLFADAALARCVAARDLRIAGAAADPEACERYAAFAHGRDCIRRFGAPIAAELLERVSEAPR